ncbi:uncharacterized protein [Oscarella lobularis]|uniref:uncharacterized protein isoform X2 n=1 Tax=Oscarella lobularis TaxID=121494 RepID=UPI0033140BA3
MRPMRGPGFLGVVHGFLDTLTTQTRSDVGALTFARSIRHQMEYFFANLSEDALYRPGKAPTFRLLTESDAKSLGLRAYFPPRSEPIYASQRRSLPFPDSSPTIPPSQQPNTGPPSSLFLDDELIMNLLVSDHGTPGWDDYRSPSPYSPGGSSLAGASEPDIPQDPLTPSDEIVDFDPDYFEDLLSMAGIDTNQDKEPISTFYPDLMTSQLATSTLAAAGAQTPSPSPTGPKPMTSTLAQILTEGVTPTPPMPQRPKTVTPPHKPKRGRRPTRDIDISPPQLGASGSASLWEFILELLADPLYEPYIRWKDRSKGQFKIYDSQVVAALWGKHKNHAGMNFDKMSRAMRYYYGKNILEKGEEGGRLEYQFQDGSQWLSYISRNLNRRNFTAPGPNQYTSSQPMRVSRRRSSQRLRGGSSPY